jgi:hypothetical protein
MWIRAAGLYLVAAVLVTWPLAAQFTSHLGALEGAGDPFLNLWILGWGMQAWLADPSAVLSGQVFDANIFHPAEGALTFSDHLLLQSLLMSPLYAITGNLVLCYNVLLLLSLTASGLAMHLLVRSVTGSAPAAFVAGLAWACWPYRTAHLLHLQLQSLYFLPLAIWALHRVVAARRWKDTLWLAVFAALQAISSVYYGVMTAIALVTAASALAVTTGQWRSSRLWSRLAVSAVVGAAITAPVAWPYWRTQQREGFGRNLFEAAAHAASAQSYMQVPPDNLLYGRTGLMLPRAPGPGERDRRHVEHQMFPGVIVAGLAVLGLWRARQSDARPVAAAAALLVLVGVVLSLGPEGVRPLYSWVADVVFGFQAIRAPARFAVVAMAGLCLLAGLGVARSNLRGPLVAALGVVMMLEYANLPLGFVAAPPVSTEAGRWLQSAPAPGAVLYLPLAVDRENSPFMVQSLEHGRPIVNGYSGQRPSFFTSLVDAFADPESVEARAVLKDTGVRFVVSPTPIRSAGDPVSPFVERVRVNEGVIYEVVWTPESETALGAMDVSEPPAPGAAPFAAGETAVYDVDWLTGPLDVSAGTVTLRVLRPDTADALAAPVWAFEATVDSASWVSRFFEAHDRFRTIADAQLKPLSHVRSLREGRRAVDRAFVFDHDARRVRSGGTVAEARSPSAMALPLSPGSRDTLTALWYIRSLPLAPGFSVALPVNDAGRSLAVSVNVGNRETIEVGGRTEEAFRVEPRISARVERRRPLEATIWLSADARRLPLVVEISAGFGRLRLKLVDYRP